MAIVQPKSLIYRKAVAHIFIIAFLCLIMFPLLMIVAISFRQGNFSVGDIIPKASTSTLDHWRLALGFDVVKLNRVSGSTVNVINTDDGKVRFYVTSEEDPSFHNFVTEPFALADVQNLKDDNTLAVEGYADTSDAEGVTYADEGATKDICKNVAKKLVMSLGEGSDVVKYVIDQNDKAGTTYGVYKESIIPPPFPVLLWLWNSVKVAFITAFLIICLSTTSAYAFARMKFAGKTVLFKRYVNFPDVPSCASTCCYLCSVR